MNDIYGRKIGFLKLMVTLLMDRLGLFRGYRNIQWEEVKRLVFICHGNICRSAYGEARARHLSLNAASAGLGAKDNGPADPQAMKVAARRQIQMDQHRTTPVNNLKLENGDLFLCMEPSQAHFMQRIVGSGGGHQVTLLGLWLDDRRPYLQDPYGLSDGYWETCFDIIDSVIENIRPMIAANAFKVRRNAEV